MEGIDGKAERLAREDCRTWMGIISLLSERGMTSNEDEYSPQVERLKILPSMKDESTDSPGRRLFVVSRHFLGESK